MIANNRDGGGPPLELLRPLLECTERSDDQERAKHLLRSKVGDEGDDLSGEVCGKKEKKRRRRGEERRGENE